MSVCLPCAAGRTSYKCYCHTLVKAPMYEVVAAHLRAISKEQELVYEKKAVALAREFDKANANDTDSRIERNRKNYRARVADAKRDPRITKVHGRCRGCVHCLKGGKP